MKTLQITLVLLLALAVSVNGQRRKQRKAYYGSQYNVEIQTLGVGNDGTKLFKVWGYGKKADIAAFEAKRNAISAAIFKGIPAGGGAALLCGGPGVRGIYDGQRQREAGSGDPVRALSGDRRVDRVALG